MAPPPPPDAQVFAAFLAWLPTAAASPEVTTLLGQFREHLLATGTPEADVPVRMAGLMRQMSRRPEAWRPMFDNIFSHPQPGFSTAPNALVARVAAGLPPGDALDAAAGQGRNAVYLATRGWRVTAFDVSDVGLAHARAQAAAAGVPLITVQSEDAAFDFGEARWDLVVLTYHPGRIATPEYVARLHRAVRPGGHVVIESFGIDPQAGPRPVDLVPADLRQLYEGWDLLELDAVIERPDWLATPSPIVRGVARRR